MVWLSAHWSALLSIVSMLLAVVVAIAQLFHANSVVQIAAQIEAIINQMNPPGPPAPPAAPSA
jgi:hypothetical protein